ncbi:MAG TPA: hypothetical protein DHV22_07945 [Xanthomarina gelatinilytica]|uniref:KilA-N domain-containing protein n=1 Tax=Xanthomarina gelatinilytica TaxID=1137281 RepID=A0A3D6BTE2_9FLAO|nr:hypothetical protein [Xanthomarina gelatinilytica]
MQTENLTAVMQFHGKNIAFQEIEGKMMVNATQMAKSFNQQPIQWLRTDQAQALIQTVTKVHKCSLDDLQVVKRGGTNPGTWFQEDIALFFAQWLSPEFYLACNTKLKELVTMQALSLPEKHGVLPIVHKGKPIYPYMEVMRALGGSVKSSATSRKRKNPEHFIKVFGRNFITSHYFDLLKGYYDYKKTSNQLSLSL